VRTPGAAAALAELCARYWAFQCDENPTLAIMASAPVTHDELLRLAPADHERRATTAKAMLAGMSAISIEGLGAGDRATYAILRRELQELVDGFELQAHRRPSLYPLGVDVGVAYVAGMVALQSEADARRWLNRLRRIPAGLQGLVESLDEGVRAGLRYPRLVIERTATQTLGVVGTPPRESPIFGPFLKAGPRGEAFAAITEAALHAIEHEVYPAFRAYVTFVREQLGKVARDTLSCMDDPQGEAFYREQVRHFTTLDIDPHEVHRFGFAEVQRITADMREVAAAAGFPGDLAGYVRRLKADPAQFAPSGEALREQLESVCKRIDGKVPEFFGRLPRTTYGVTSMPPSVATTQPPALAMPGPADHSAAGQVWITSLPDRCPRYMHLPLALHEAWPGHVMHVALTQELDGLPAFRRHGALGYSVWLEGWALYCERLGEEMGFYDTPDKRYGRLEMEMWRALRLVVDTGIHAKGWSREQAIDLMLQHMAMPRPTIEAEVDRYIGLPAQALAYQLGNRKFRELRERAEARLGDRFNRRAFHDALMAAGPVTLGVLDEHIEWWIGEVERA